VGLSCFFGGPRGTQDSRKYESDVYLPEIATKNGVGGYLSPSLYFYFYFLWRFFVRFSTRGVQKHHTNFLEKVHVKNFLPKKVEIFFSSSIVLNRFFLSDCFKSPHKCFLKNQTWGLKKSQKKVGTG
jgi:hypothetical protein